MRPHLWKLTLLAGLIWTAILVQHNAARSTATAPDRTETVQPATLPASEKALILAPATLPVALEPATSTPPPPTPAPTATPTLPPVLHTVKAGEAPLSIAAQYGLAVETLLAVNKITDPTTLQIGQQLLIPITATPTPRASPTPKASPTPSPTQVFHTVRRGEILLTIAAMYDTTVEAIMIANGIIDPRTLQIGQRLLIPPDKGSPLGVQTVVYKIESGDTLLGLAGRYGSTLEDILVTNPDLEPTLLQVGQEIIIPLTQPKANQASTPALPRITSPVESPPELAALEQAMIDGVNAQRQSHGLAPYAANEALISLARTHAQDMTGRGYFSHVTLEGLTIRDRFAERGLDFYWVGENIQRNVQPIDQAVQYALDWFMNSRVHRDNILHRNFDQIGVGVTEGPPGWYTFVLDFAGE